ncbi:hypothetical protein ACLMJK_006200 [Lecanora helva]
MDNAGKLNPPRHDDANSPTERSTVSKEIATPPRSLRTSISPPPSRTRKFIPTPGRHDHLPQSNGPRTGTPAPNLTAIEAGQAKIQDHLDFFSTHLFRYAKPKAPLSNPDFRALYSRNQHPHGRHFVIHQHDHPVAGVHYDLRLQINETSSISWAIMYGLPGNPNSRRLNRNATETRVHNIWNHLIETASAATGSLLIWDTGEYEMLPYRADEQETDDEAVDDSEQSNRNTPEVSDSQKLHQAFQNRKIRIRLHGSHLPKNYTLSIRLLASENRHNQPPKPSRKRRKKDPQNSEIPQVTPPTSDVDDDIAVSDVQPSTLDASASALERELAEQEDEEISLTNAYPGATNDIGSIHQRRWYLSMDRYSSGFRPLRTESNHNGGKRKWVRRWDGEQLVGFEPFYVMGRDVERSVVTGRNADEVMKDEGARGFVGRKGWMAVTE